MMIPPGIATIFADCFLHRKWSGDPPTSPILPLGIITAHASDSGASELPRRPLNPHGSMADHLISNSLPHSKHVHATHQSMQNDAYDHMTCPFPRRCGFRQRESAKHTEVTTSEIAISRVLRSVHCRLHTFFLDIDLARFDSKKLCVLSKI